MGKVLRRRRENPSLNSGESFAFCVLTFELAKQWLYDMDSNHDKGLQRALCYHYTIGHAALRLVSRGAQSKANFRLASFRNGAARNGEVSGVRPKMVAGFSK